MRIKLTLRFLIAAFIVTMIYIPAAQAQANLTFSGGGGAPLTITLQQSVSYKITNTNCSSSGPYFNFDEVGNLFGFNLITFANNTITYSIANGAQRPVDSATSNYTGGEVNPNDSYLYEYPALVGGMNVGDTVVLKAGTLTTRQNIAASAPMNNSFPTFIFGIGGHRCSENGVAAGTTAASVSISGRVLTNNRRGLSNALVYLTDSSGDMRTARTNSLGYYRFEDIAAGQSVTVTVVSKRYQFAPQILNLNEEMNGVNFLANN